MAVGAGLGYAAAAIDGLPADWGITIGAVAAFILVSGSAGVGKAPATADPCQYSPSSCQLPSFHPTVPPLTLTP